MTEQEVAMLRFEQGWWRYAGSKEAEIGDRFGMSVTRYYQVLNALLSRPEAVEHAPLLVNRLRRLRTARQAARATRRAGLG